MPEGEREMMTLPRARMTKKMSLNGGYQNLWHTTGVRNRWKEGTRSAKTVAGVALALSTLMAAGEAYGVISEQGD